MVNFMEELRKIESQVQSALAKADPETRAKIQEQSNLTAPFQDAYKAINETHLDRNADTVTTPNA